jgi:hypothetical protein
LTRTDYKICTIPVSAKSMSPRLPTGKDAVFWRDLPEDPGTSGYTANCGVSGDARILGQVSQEGSIPVNRKPRRLLFPRSKLIGQPRVRGERPDVQFAVCPEVPGSWGRSPKKAASRSIGNLGDIYFVDPGKGATMLKALPGPCQGNALRIAASMCNPNLQLLDRGRVPDIVITTDVSQPPTAHVDLRCRAAIFQHSG